MGLETYRRKRRFSRTPEPRGQVARRAGDSFTIQRHHASRLHYDFRLELDGVLKSWAVPKGPSLDPQQRRLAVEVEDHPLEYGTFEGEIPKGQYGGGTVVLWDRGSWEPLGDAREGLRKGHLRFSLKGKKLWGRWDLIRLRGRDGDAGKRQWLLIKVDDEHSRPAQEYDVTEARPESVAPASSRTRVWRSNRPEAARPRGARPARRRSRPRLDPGKIPGAVRAPMPTKIEPQLATLVEEAPSGDDWLFEIKLDGYRIVAFLEDRQARLVSRRGNEWTAALAPLAASLSRLGVKNAVLDGEAVVLDERGISSFQAIQNLLSRAGRGRLTYYAFDLLYLEGWDLRGASLKDRKEALAKLLAGAPPDVRLSEHVEGRGADFFRSACDLGLEGVMAKRADGPYIGARTKQWLKLKCLKRQEFVVCGFTDPAGTRSGFGALVLGVRKDGVLTHVGRAGTGFDDKTLKSLTRRLKALERPTSPFPHPPAGRAARGIHWVEPELVAEIAFGEWTEDGILRHPRFLGLREDKPAGQVVVEKPEPARRAVRQAARAADGQTSVAGVVLSHPEKEFYPDSGVTKLELARYYELAAPYALPYLSRRPLSLVRCPEGHSRPCFFQKHLGDMMPEAARGVEIVEGGKKQTYAYIEDAAGLVSMAQLGALEIHPWGSRVETLEQPDVMTIDLDPAPGVPWTRLIEAARDTRARLLDLGLKSFLKTTGGKGLHVVVPLKPRAGWERVKAFSKSVVELMARDAPKRYTTNMAKAARPGKIFLDYLRNGRGATAVGAYSTRARAGAPVAAPLSWNELTERLDPKHFTVRTMAARFAALKADPWAGFFEAEQSLVEGP